MYNTHRVFLNIIIRFLGERIGTCLYRLKPVMFRNTEVYWHDPTIGVAHTLRAIAEEQFK